MEKYEIRTYVFEGGIREFEIPCGNIEETISETTNPAQTDPSLLVKALVKSEE
jgi:hypothetical protein